MTTTAVAHPTNTGIVPPWLTTPVSGSNENSGIVPPWLTTPPTNSPNRTIGTQFVREPADIPPSPMLDAMHRR